MSGVEMPTVWSDMRLLAPVSEAIISLGWKKPTTVQSAAIPPMLKGQDVSLQGATGSGKTAAFAIPAVQRVVSERQSGKKGLGPTALILAPSVELAEQTTDVLELIAKYIKPRIIIDNACDNAKPPSVASDIIVATPSSIAQLLKRRSLPESIVNNLRMLVIDEADVLVGMTSLAIIQKLLPSVLQTVLVSATLTEGVATIKNQLLRNPTNVKLTEEVGPSDAADGDIVIDARQTNKVRHLQHHYLVATDDAHNYTLLYSLFRLNLIEGKTLIFVDEEEHTYKLQHFLEQLSVPTVVYDASLPVNVRLDVLRRFQRNKAGALICTDKTLENAELMQVDLSAEDKESAGLTRGVDFHNVKNVIIFDGISNPSAVNFSAYTHRAGRTGRAGAEGLVITIFTVAQAQNVSHPLREYLIKSRNEHFRPYKRLDRADAARMQYRVDSALANVTRNAARKLRVATVASELARSSYLNTHMNTSDTAALRKIVDKVKSKVQADKHLITVPRYMGLKQVDNVEEYRKRVKAEHPLNRDEVFKRVAKKRELDPLMKIVESVKSKEHKRREIRREASGKPPLSANKHTKATRASGPAEGKKAATPAAPNKA